MSHDNEVSARVDGAQSIAGRWAEKSQGRFWDFLSSMAERSEPARSSQGFYSPGSKIQMPLLPRALGPQTLKRSQGVRELREKNTVIFINF